MEYRTLSTVFRPAGKGDRALRFGVKKKRRKNTKKVLTETSSCANISLALSGANKIRCASGGIGRLAGFRCQCSQGRAGSTPASRTKKKDMTKGHVFLFGFRGPKAASALWFKMLGGNEFRLRRGFACGKTLVRRKSAAGQKAGWVVLFLRIPFMTRVSKYRF